MRPRIGPPPSEETTPFTRRASRVLEPTSGSSSRTPRARAAGRPPAPRVDAPTGRVRIPPRLVQDALAAAPRDVVLAGRDPAHDVRCDGSRTCPDSRRHRRVHARSPHRRAPGLDHAGPRRRRPVADAAAEIGVVWNVVPRRRRAAHDPGPGRARRLPAHTGKHVQGEVQRAEEVPYVMEMLAAASADGRWDPARPVLLHRLLPGAAPPARAAHELGPGRAGARGRPHVHLQHGPRRRDGAGDDGGRRDAGQRRDPQLARPVPARAPGPRRASTWPTPACWTCAPATYAAASPESVAHHARDGRARPDVQPAGHGDGPHRRRQRLLA